MSAGLGRYAAMPGGGSLVRRVISRMRRALVAGFILEEGNELVFTVQWQWANGSGRYCICIYLLLPFHGRYVSPRFVWVAFASGVYFLVSRV